LTLGVRPEHVRPSDDAPYRAQVIATEYLGTTQIVTFATPNGQVKARIPSHVQVRIGDRTGLDLDGRTITIFDAQTGKALPSEANQGVLRHG
jgi:multiple sugar transport system ATP-binding protein